MLFILFDVILWKQLLNFKKKSKCNKNGQIFLKNDLFFFIIVAFFFCSISALTKLYVFSSKYDIIILVSSVMISFLLSIFLYKPFTAMYLKWEEYFYKDEEAALFISTMVLLLCLAAFLLFYVEFFHFPLEHIIIELNMWLRKRWIAYKMADQFKREKFLYLYQCRVARWEWNPRMWERALKIASRGEDTIKFFGRGPGGRFTHEQMVDTVKISNAYLEAEGKELLKFSKKQLYQWYVEVTSRNNKFL
jgi:hypothetical protein